VSARDRRARGAAPPGRFWWIEAAVALVGRPDLWPVALAESVAMAPRGWWYHWPPAPLASPAWLAFRMETAYGDAAARPTPADVIAWLEWCRVSRRHAQLR
jgi:hypothetical protein